MALPALLKDHSDLAEVREPVAFAAWRKVAGEQLCEHTAPLALECERLIVAVPDRAWQRNLEQLSSEMLYRINSKVGNKLVGYIEFRIDKKSVTRSGDTSEIGADREMEALDEISGSLRKAADKISDDAMRRIFLLAASSCLARTSRMGAID